MEHVFCISCGYDFRTQNQVVTEYGNSVDDGWTRRTFAGRRFTVVKSEEGTPTLVVKRRFFWFMPFPQSEYPLTNYREVGTSSRDIVRRQRASFSDRHRDNSSSLFGGNSNREYVGLRYWGEAASAPSPTERQVGESIQVYWLL